ncbi:N-acetyltransferase [Spirochaetia bacterium]|nr:N-acetyltransferase [Spirochaetia bacterium]GHU31834.1 N-acetyltransferase [Spirochaetia bacterium]
MIRNANAQDAPAFCTLYNHYIEKTCITFEEEPVPAEIMENRIRTIISRFPWLVWEGDAGVQGYAYIHQWHERSAYRFTVEDSIYLAPGAEGKGIGTQLLASLLIQTDSPRRIMSVITLPNDRSIALHEKFGFTKVGHFKKVGFKLNQWLDVGYWELLL